MEVKIILYIKMHSHNINESSMSSLERSEEKSRCPRRPPAPPFFVSKSQMRGPSWELSCLTAVCLSDLRASLLCRELGR